MATPVIEFAWPHALLHPEFFPIVPSGLCVRDFALALHAHLGLDADTSILVCSASPPHAPLSGRQWLNPGDAVVVRRTHTPCTTTGAGLPAVPWPCAPVTAPERKIIGVAWRVTAPPNDAGLFAPKSAALNIGRARPVSVLVPDPELPLMVMCTHVRSGVAAWTVLTAPGMPSVRHVAPSVADALAAVTEFVSGHVLHRRSVFASDVLAVVHACDAFPAAQRQWVSCRHSAVLSLRRACTAQHRALGKLVAPVDHQAQKQRTDET